MEKKKVLLVDDVRLFLHLEETFFKRTGCRVFSAANGREALAAAAKHQPDLILLDYLMPDMTGDLVCREIRAREDIRHIPIIIVSTSAQEADIAKCLEAGANDYVTKPINPQQMLAKAAELMQIAYRLHFRIPVHFKVQGEASKLVFTAFSLNISIGGMLLECDKNLAPGTVVELRFRLGENEPDLEVVGEVARSAYNERKNTYQTGIKFRELSSPAQVRLRDLVESKVPRA